MPQLMLSSYMFPDMYANLGYDVGNLGCVMASLEPLQISDIVDEADLYENPEWEHGHGYVSQEECHVTILYGLLQPAMAMKKAIDEVFAGGGPLEPIVFDEVEIAGVDYFEGSREGEDYYCLIAKIVPSSMLIEANARVRLLPHIDTYPLSYVPHATLCYIKKDDQKRDRYISELNARFVGMVVPILGLDYGT